MKDNEYKVSGYSFTDIKEYKEAKREAETIEYIRANTDLNDRNKVLKLYHKLVERQTLKTVVGYGFLKELQNKILKEGIIGEDKLPDIKVVKEEKKIFGKVYKNQLEHTQENKYRILSEEYRIRHRNSRIINLFLILIIAIMIGIAIFSNRNVFQKYEEKIIDKYAAWEEELDAREQALREREEDE
ncbi:hypothetical protein I5677_05185 [Mobilitalea sibirica]|uniref:Uncharacterized protein n=1 Tax=Mobilitalea sibirica TaxID=1462919 RepID=A0A8J7H1U6_9FIRM|nr:hypothetical protein [Mobilitalea sibirica]MBH1940290.1 hypothetical protein [Mobilitalea sibirica]